MPKIDLAEAATDQGDDDLAAAAQALVEEVQRTRAQQKPGQTKRRTETTPTKPVAPPEEDEAAIDEIPVDFVAPQGIDGDEQVGASEQETSGSAKSRSSKKDQPVEPVEKKEPDEDFMVPVGDPSVPVAKIEKLTKIYGRQETEVRALRSVSATFGRGEFVAIMGPSGSGKSTLLHCLAGLDRPTDGTVLIDGKSISDLRESELSRMRGTTVSLVFQADNLLPMLTAGENIMLPLKIANKRVSAQWIDKVIDVLGIQSRLKYRPHELSGGQRQRVAIARALITRPLLICADEPTGNVDSGVADDVLSLLRKASTELGQSVVMGTHDPVAASHADRVLFLKDGKFVSEVADPTVGTVIETMGTLFAGV